MINLKTEIIYFKCTTDFEFEFNLNTALQMRLFTSCPDNDKSFLNALALAVSRSRAIVITSKFDEDLITKLAASIGFKTETLSPDEYGIITMETDKIITGGVPLVTDDGIYGGIILESGPQSLIIITNERAIRKKLMNSLVHTYLIDVANVVSGGTIINEKVEEKVEQNDNVIIDDIDLFDDVTDDTVVVDAVDDSSVFDNTDDSINDVIVDNTDDTILENISNDSNDIKKVDFLDFKDQQEDNSDNYADLPKKRVSDIFTIILSIVLLILICFIIYSLVIEPFLNGITIKENLKHVFGFLFK